MDLLNLLLAAHRVHINVTGHHQMTPLHVAAWHGHSDVIRTMIKSGNAHSYYALSLTAVTCFIMIIIRIYLILSALIKQKACSIVQSHSCNLFIIRVWELFKVWIFFKQMCFKGHFKLLNTSAMVNTLRQSIPQRRIRVGEGPLTDLGLFFYAQVIRVSHHCCQLAMSTSWTSSESLPLLYLSALVILRSSSCCWMVVVNWTVEPGAIWGGKAFHVISTWA